MPSARFPSAKVFPHLPMIFLNFRRTRIYLPLSICVICTLLSRLHASDDAFFISRRHNLSYHVSCLKILITNDFNRSTEDSLYEHHAIANRAGENATRNITFGLRFSRRETRFGLRSSWCCKCVLLFLLSLLEGMLRSALLLLPSNREKGRDGVKAFVA